MMRIATQKNKAILEQKMELENIKEIVNQHDFSRVSKLLTYISEAPGVQFSEVSLYQYKNVIIMLKRVWDNKYHYVGCLNEFIDKSYLNSLAVEDARVGELVNYVYEQFLKVLPRTSWEIGRYYAGLDLIELIYEFDCMRRIIPQIEAMLEQQYEDEDRVLVEGYEDAIKELLVYVNEAVMKTNKIDLSKVSPCLKKWIQEVIETGNHKKILYNDSQVVQYVTNDPSFYIRVQQEIAQLELQNVIFFDIDDIFIWISSEIEEYLF